MEKPVLYTSENRHGAKFIFVGPIEIPSCLECSADRSFRKLVPSHHLVWCWFFHLSLPRPPRLPACKWLGLPSFHELVEKLCFGQYFIGATAGVPMALKGVFWFFFKGK